MKLLLGYPHILLLAWTVAAVVSYCCKGAAPLEVRRLGYVCGAFAAAGIACVWFFALLPFAIL